MKTLSTSKSRNPIAKLVRRPDLQYRQLGMDMSIFDPSTAKLHILNATATAIWYHITPDRTIKNITEVMALSFSSTNKDDVKDITNDVKWILSQFYRLKLLINHDAKIPKPLPGYKKMKRYIPDQEISSIARGYIKPSFKTFTLEELKKIFETKIIGGGNMGGKLFADTWGGEEEPDPKFS